MKRRSLLKGAAALPFLPTTKIFADVLPAVAGAARVRPGDPEWPVAEEWEALSRAVSGNLLRPTTIWQTCAQAPRTPDCLARLGEARNPIALGDDPGGTQVSGWLDGWAPRASAYAVAARSTSDVVAGINFVRRHNLRLVVKGGGHSYLGGSNAPDSLLIWTRAMNRIELHDAFVPLGSSMPPTPAVTAEAGCMWIDVYTAVTTQAGRYVQGGGCASVGVAGLVQGGGFGSFSKRYGLAAASLLQAEIVTADGIVRTVNASREPDLFWALKGGGSGAGDRQARRGLSRGDPRGPERERDAHRPAPARSADARWGRRARVSRCGRRRGGATASRHRARGTAGVGVPARPRRTRPADRVRVMRYSSLRPS